MSDIALKGQVSPPTEVHIARNRRPPPEPKFEVFSSEEIPPQKPVRKILVATNFSSASARAVEFAVDLSQEWSAELTILHVIDISAQSAEGESLPAAQLMSHLWRKGFERIGRLAFLLSGRVHAQTVVEEGLPYEVIAEKSHDFDLVIIGRARRKTHWNIFSHQTVQRVLQNAACPVIVAPERPDAQDVVLPLP
jgi:nucleotide-binding universal stress UspA family protein